MSDKVYLDNLQTFYSERLKAGLKKRFMKCSGCSGNKQFIINQGKLYFTCGSSSGECGLQFSIDLAEYIFLPELKEAYNSVQLTINKSKHPDIYSASEIKKYEEFVSYTPTNLNASARPKDICSSVGLVPNASVAPVATFNCLHNCVVLILDATLVFNIVPINLTFAPAPNIVLSVTVSVAVPVPAVLPDTLTISP